MVEKGFPKDPAEVELIPGAAAAICRLRALGLRAGIRTSPGSDAGI